MKLFASAACATALLSCVSVRAAPTQEELYESVKALQAEVRSLRRELETEKAARRSAPRKVANAWTADPPPSRTAAPARPALVPDALTWAGSYAGAAFGFGTSRTYGVQTQLQQPSPFNSVQPFAEEGHPTSAAISLFAGHDFALGSHMIGGLQVDGTLWHSAGTSTIVSVGRDSFNPQPFLSKFPARLQPSWSVSALAKVGYIYSSELMLYIIGGATYGGMESSLSGIFNEPAGHGYVGATFGFGGEARIAPNWTAIADYRFTHFFEGDGKQALLQSGSFFNTFGFVARTHEQTDMHHLRLGVVRRFE